MMGDALMTDDDWLGVHNLLWSVPRRCAACLLQVLADPLLRRSRRPLAFSHRWAACYWRCRVRVLADGDSLRRRRGFKRPGWTARAAGPYDHVS